MAHHALPSFFGRATLAMDQHVDLLNTARRLRNACQSLGSQSLPMDPEIPELIHELCALLPAHFAAEEADGYFGTMVAEYPRLEARVSRLVVEHEAMRAALKELGELAELADPDPELGIRVNSLLDTLHAHERAETVLLQEFFRIE